MSPPRVLSQPRIGVVAAIVGALLIGYAAATTSSPVAAPTATTHVAAPTRTSQPVAIPTQSDWPAEPGPLDWYLRALHQREAGDLDGAIAAMEEARRLAPRDADLALEAARTYEAARAYGAAAVAYADASALAPERVDLAKAQARFHLARAFRVRVAETAAARAVKLAPTDPEAIALLDRARTAAALAED